MKFATVLALLVGAVSALPVEVESVAIPVERDAPEARSAAEIQAAQEAEAQALFLSRNEVVDGDSSRCPRAVLIFARGSLELPNMVRSAFLILRWRVFANVAQGLLAGPLLAASLERQLGDSNVWVQGVGGPYQALLSPNFLPEGTNRQSIDEAKRLFRLAHSKCPNAKIFAAGYRYVGVAPHLDLYLPISPTVREQPSLATPSQSLLAQSKTGSSALLCSGIRRIGRIMALFPTSPRRGRLSTVRRLMLSAGGPCSSCPTTSSMRTKPLDLQQAS